MEEVPDAVAAVDVAGGATAASATGVLSVAPDAHVGQFRS